VAEAAAVHVRVFETAAAIAAVSLALYVHRAQTAQQNSQPVVRDTPYMAQAMIAAAAHGQCVLILPMAPRNSMVVWVQWMADP